MSLAKSLRLGNICGIVLQNFEGKRSLQTTTGLAVQMKTAVRNFQINFERVGYGPHPVLCLPGAMGCIESDFSSQLDAFDPDEFTLVAWDPPGYGKSRPPDRDVLSDPRLTLCYDGDLAHDLMTKLGYERYSLLGWNDGAITAMFMASSFSQSIHKMVIRGAKAYLTKSDRENLIQFRNIESWPLEMKRRMIDMYGKKYFRTTWTHWVDNFIELYEKDGDICKKVLSFITCQALIIHEAGNPLLDLEHSQYLHKYITNATYRLMHNKGMYRNHEWDPDELNSIVQSYLLEPDHKNESIVLLHSLID